MKIIPIFMMVAKIVSAHPMSVFGPSIDGNQNGDFVVVWSALNGVVYELNESFLSGDGSWSPPQVISTSGSSAIYPNVSMNEEGDVFVIWQEPTETGSDICASHGLFGQMPSLPQKIAEGVFCFPNIKVDTNGSALALWEEMDSSTKRIWSALYETGRGWLFVDPLSEPSSSFMAFDLAVHPSSGRGIALWQNNEGSFQGIRGAFLPFLKVDRTFLVSSNGLEATNPLVVCNGAGDFFAIWQETVASSSVFQFAVHSEGEWGSLHQIAAEEGQLINPRISIDGLGRIAIIGQNVQGEISKVFATIRNEEGIWDEGTIIGEDEEVSSPKIIVNESLQAIAVWKNGVEGAHEIRKALFVPDTGWQAPVTISTGCRNVSPHIVVDSEGRGVIAWQSEDGLQTERFSSFCR